MRYLNHRREGAPCVSLFGMCLSGALSDGAWKIMNYLAKRKFPTPPSGYDNPEGTFITRTGSHLENEITVSSKITPSKPIRMSLRQNMVRNIKVYNKHVKKHFIVHCQTSVVASSSLGRFGGIS